MMRTVGVAVVGFALLLACDDQGPEVVMLPAFGDVLVVGDHREVEVRFESEGVTLVGTLYLPQSGSDLPVVAVNPGSSWDSRSSWDEVGVIVGSLDVGVLSYDRRGFGASGGTLPSGSDPAFIDILARDLAAAATALQSAPLVRSDRVGVVGSSFGGWVAPVAANLAPQAIAYTIVIVGGVVSPGQETLFDDLTGYSVCQRTATPMSEIIQALRDAGPSGFDPQQSLEALSQPAIWIYGELDFSHPAEFSAELLAEVEARMTKDWTVVIVANANHEMIEGGGICDTTGPPADPISPMMAWMDQIFGL